MYLRILLEIGIDTIKVRKNNDISNTIYRCLIRYGDYQTMHARCLQPMDMDQASVLCKEIHERMTADQDRLYPHDLSFVNKMDVWTRVGEIAAIAAGIFLVSSFFLMAASLATLGFTGFVLTGLSACVIVFACVMRARNNKALENPLKKEFKKCLSSAMSIRGHFLRRKLRREVLASPIQQRTLDQWNVFIFEDYCRRYPIGGISRKRE